MLTANQSFILGYTNETDGLCTDIPVILFDDFTCDTKYVDFPFKVKSSAMKLLRTNNCTDINFAYELLQHIDYQPQGHSRHWISVMQPIKIALPSLAEQKRIATIFKFVNERIQKQTELIEHLKKYKRGLFEAIFTQKIRLVNSETSQPWKKYLLSDFTERIVRKNKGMTDIPLTISAQYGLVDQRDFFSKVVASADMSGYYLLNNGEYAYNRSTSNDYPLGSIKRLDEYSNGAVSTLYLCFMVKDEIVLNDLVKWYFETSQWHKGVKEICAEGARNHGLLNVPIEDFFNTEHILPSDPYDQKIIAEFLEIVQLKYEKAEEELSSCIKVKNALLQQLFI